MAAAGEDAASNGASQIRAKPKKSSQTVEAPKDARLARLREEMAKALNGRGVDAYIVPSEDPHQSEYSAGCFSRRAFISSFTGSAGTAVVTKEKAALWTDGRYFLQAEQQLGPEWQLMRAGQPGVPEISAWLVEVLPEKATVGIDPFLHSANEARDLTEGLAEKSCSLAPLYEHNLVDLVWRERRPAPPSAPVRVHPLKYAGKDAKTKLAELRAELAEAGATGIVVPVLDEVAWLLNVRGGDVPHCPVTIAYAIVEMEDAFLFVEEGKVTPEVKTHLDGAGVTIKPYDSLVSHVKQAASQGAKLWMDPAKVSTAIVTAFQKATTEYYCDAVASPKVDRESKKRKVEAVEEDIKAPEEGEAFNRASQGPALISRPSPIAAAKSTKNGAELEGMRQAHLRDAAALAYFWAWLEKEVSAGKYPTEVEVAQKLEGFRSEQEGFLDTSFDTIAGSGPNGAIIHYSAQEATCGIVDDKKLFLLDSGGQYVDGTTDITRTSHFGQPSGYQKNCFTRVLKGHIALDQAVFPEGTPGFVLDVLARKALWEIGLDYRHGTGHGVGAALNVHEGPQGISPRFGNLTGLTPGMIVSNEPGYYEDGSFGIRIENLLALTEVETPNRFGGNTYLGFERLTFVPIQTKMIDLTLMSDAEIQWVNEYHEDVFTKIGPRVEGAAWDWLRQNTLPISRSSQVAELPNASEAVATR